MSTFRALTAAVVLLLGLTAAAQQAPRGGVRDPAWSPDGRRIAFSYLDQIWTAAPDGRRARALRPASAAAERDPAWSPDGRTIAFAADAGEGFDIYAVPAGGGRARRLTDTPADDRWPSWTGDGRVIFSRREGWRWRLFAMDGSGGGAAPLFPDTPPEEEEREGRVSPDSTRIAYISDRDSSDGDVDLWVAELAGAGRDRVRRTRIVAERGLEGFPAWSPDGSRVAFYAVREGVGSVWVAPADVRDETRPRPHEPPVLASRHGGVPAWAPDGRRIAIADLPAPEPTYNGNPRRGAYEPPPLFSAEAFRLWLVDAPTAIDSGAHTVSPPEPVNGRLLSAFDRVWDTLRALYYSHGASADEWVRLRERHRPRAAAARDAAALESALDELIAEQPLIKPAVSSDRAVVVSGHPLASSAGLMALEKGGNVVDAAIAVSFALGVVEPDASGIGGDGMALIYLKGMSEPVAIDYKDQTPIKASRDNPLIQRGRSDGPAAANIPGVVAGMDLMFRRYGSGKIAWRDLIEPAIRYAEDGFTLDEALPTSIAEGRAFLDKYAASRRIYLPDGRIPKPGDRFVNADYGATLRAIADDGAPAFYRGAIASRIADDMARNGGLITRDDLAQYRAIERRPLRGRYRDHEIFSSPPPVPTGLALIETLQILQNYRPRAGASYFTDADYFHHAIEAWKVRDQGARTGDPAHVEVDLGPHLEEAHAASLFARIDPAKASRYARGPEPAPSGESGRDVPERIGRGTTAFAVADAEGNMIAVTQTLSTWGGTFYVSEGLGFLYNNHLRSGRGGRPAAPLPLARSSSTSVPTLVFRSTDGARVPRLAAAAAGNAWIGPSVYEIILNVIDGGLPAQRAIEAPRFLVGRDPQDPEIGRMQIEDRFPRAILDDLAARGHRFQKIGRKGEVRYGYAAAAVVDPVARRVEAGTEPRRSHAAAAPGASRVGTTSAAAPRQP